MWFATGLVMLYVPFPSWSDEERLAHLPPVDTGMVSVMPDAALAISGVSDLPSQFRLEMLAGAPVYRIMSPEGRASVSAVTGAVLTDVSPADAERHVRLVFPAAQPQLTAAIDADQWTPTRKFDPHRPLYRFALNDRDDTVLYVSSTTGEIMQQATRRERAWNWVGAVPHWIYFTPIRRDQEVWRQAVMWLSAPLLISAISGVWVGILRMPVRAAKAGASLSPYRGWMKWHHIAGLAGGLFVVTWIFSGWLSVNPFHWFARTDFTPTQLTSFAGWTPNSRLATTAAQLQRISGAADISFGWTGGTPLMTARVGSSIALYNAANGDPVVVPDDALVAAAARMYPKAAISRVQRLIEPSLYWYSHHDKRPLPVLEIEVSDASRTTTYVDPASARVVGLIDNSARAYRWMFDFLHDYDLPVLLRNQPARDILVWLLSIAGLIISVSGVVIGWRTLKRQFN